MRTTSMMSGLLLLLAVLWLLVSLLLPTAADMAAEHLGRQKAGRAIVPEEVRQRWQQGKK